MWRAGGTPAATAAPAERNQAKATDLRKHAARWLRVCGHRHRSADTCPRVTDGAGGAWLAMTTAHRTSPIDLECHYRSIGRAVSVATSSSLDGCQNGRHVSKSPGKAGKRFA